MPVISLTGVGRRYGRYQALADVTADIGTPTITGEAAELLDRVLVIDHGRVVLDAPADDLRGAGTIVTGPADRVERFVADRADRARRYRAAAGLSWRVHDDGACRVPGPAGAIIVSPARRSRPPRYRPAHAMEHCRCPDHHDAPSSWLASLCPGRRNAAGYLGSTVRPALPKETHPVVTRRP